MRPLLILLAASLLALGFSLSSAGRSADAGAEPSSARAFASPVLRTHCGRPRRLRLDRFEDGSAQLLCDGRLLVRVHVPG
jgi:hypothetical protein